MRAPIEYSQGHIPGALSFPLFTDEERARIGTTYKQASQDKAVLLGLDLFGPKMSQMVKVASKLAPGKKCGCIAGAVACAVGRCSGY
ncbi:hypothetical protein [Hymenobacter volaticus]|uniref:Rhodanese domain-containing protein n=1 Tax=Hymenobacter volaticus TaxID=2932254 RepID=A0ABY4G8B2_9BACT|nr:hypothetical protein [Hymenobacter volaticus]UOQ66714.1 hypothetical protein MUN86_01940 [Hymenobacter volaticus]